MEKSSFNQRLDEVWAGTRTRVDLSVDPPQQLEAEIWVETSTGQIRSFDLVPAGSDLTSFSEALWRAVSAPAEDQTPYRPGQLVVDRAELRKAIAPLAKMQQMKVVVDPDVAENFRELLDEMESELASGRDLRLAVGDCTPELVAEFYDMAYDYLEAALWETWSGEWLELKGLSDKPLYCTVIGGDGEPGLVLCWDREGADQLAEGADPADGQIPSLGFMIYREDEIGPRLELEIQEHGWRRHPLGAAILLRGDLPDRSEPTSEELKLMTRALEAVTRYLTPDKVTGRSRKIKLTSGEPVQVKIDRELSIPRYVFGDDEEDDDFQDSDFAVPDPEEALPILDSLASEGCFGEAAMLAMAVLSHSGPSADPRLLVRLAAYSYQVQGFAELEELWSSSTEDCPPFWYYVGALTAHALADNAQFQKRLKQGLKVDPALGKRLLGRAAKSDEDFLRLWRPLWKQRPEALDTLKQFLS